MTDSELIPLRSILAELAPQGRPALLPALHAAQQLYGSLCRTGCGRSEPLPGRAPRRCLWRHRFLRDVLPPTGWSHRGTRMQRAGMRSCRGRHGSGRTVPPLADRARGNQLGWRVHRRACPLLGLVRPRAGTACRRKRRWSCRCRASSDDLRAKRAQASELCRRRYSHPDEQLRPRPSHFSGRLPGARRLCRTQKSLVDDAAKLCSPK